MRIEKERKIRGKEYGQPRLNRLQRHRKRENDMDREEKTAIKNMESTKRRKRKMKTIIGYTTGVYDMFHIGHLNILRRAKEQCDFLIVGVSTDELVEREKHKTPVIPFAQRCEIVSAIRYVDKVVPQTDKNKLGAWENYRFDKMFVGSDWKGSPEWKRYEGQLAPHGVEIVYLAHTDGISSTILAKKIAWIKE